METLFRLDAQLLFHGALLAVSVFLLFGALSYLLFEPARKLMEQRKRRIQEDLAQAQIQKQEAEDYKTEYEKKRKQADVEAEALLQKSRQRAYEQERALLDEAMEKVMERKEQARKELALERQQAKEVMKKEMISLAQLLTEKVVATSINESIQNSLVEETLKEMSEQTWANL